MMEKVAKTTQGAIRIIKTLGGYPVTVRAMQAAGRPTCLHSSDGVTKKLKELLSRSPQGAVVIRVNA